MCMSMLTQLRSALCVKTINIRTNANWSVGAALEVHVERLQARISGAPRRPATAPATAAAARKWK